MNLWGILADSTSHRHEEVWLLGIRAHSHGVILQDLLLHILEQQQAWDCAENQKVRQRDASRHTWPTHVKAARSDGNGWGLTAKANLCLGSSWTHSQSRMCPVCVQLICCYCGTVQFLCVLASSSKLWSRVQNVSHSAAGDSVLVINFLVWPLLSWFMIHVTGERRDMSSSVSNQIQIHIVIQLLIKLCFWHSTI